MLSELYIRSVEIQKENISIDISQYPLTLPVVKNTNRIVFKKPVTYFVGENGREYPGFCVNRFFT
jgi:predicted ATPase